MNKLIRGMIVTEDNDSVSSDIGNSQTEPDGQSSMAFDTNSSGETTPTPTNQQDVEVREIHRHARKDTKRVQAWRILLLAVLAATSVIVTFFTYSFMESEEDESFHRAFDQFSRTIQEAALSQQHSLRDTVYGLSNSVTSHAMENNLTWPFFRMPLFESVAEDARHLSGMEIITLIPRVPRTETDAYIAHVNQHYEEMVHNGYQIEKGSLDGLKPVGYHPYISRPVGPGKFAPDDKNRRDYFPSWLFSPPPSTYGLINWNVATVLGHVINSALFLQNETLVSEVRPYIGVPVAFTQEEHEQMHDASDLSEGSVEHPHSFFFMPVYELLRDPQSPVVAFLAGGVAWDYALRGLLPEGVRKLVAVIRNTCNQTFTYELDGPVVQYRGPEDGHEHKFCGMKRTINLAIFDNPALAERTPGHCMYRMDIYPTSDFENQYKTPTPKVFVMVIAAFFFVLLVIFFIFDLHVEGRYQKLTFSAARSNAIVASLFPESIRDKLMMQQQPSSRKNLGKNEDEKQEAHPSSSHHGGGGTDTIFVADLFLETTIIFADIAGFTAWSSVREPNQVFQLLEGVYLAFDRIARKRKIFKVETVGDCYVAAAGIPKPRNDHALAAIRFAKDIVHRMRVVTKQLELSLGPDTSDLSLRIGIHSGPVTGGMLRGDRARFQLFGDTMNTAARMESAGTAGKIHISDETARLVMEGGRKAWLMVRKDKIEIKGKGRVTTYWVRTFREEDETAATTSVLFQPTNGEEGSTAVAPAVVVQADPSSSNNEESLHNNATPHEVSNDNLDRRRRLIDWNVETLAKLLRQIVARRETTQDDDQMRESYCEVSSNDTDALSESQGTFLDEVQEVIALPEFNAAQQKLRRDPAAIVLPPEVTAQLHDYVSCIEQLYRDNAFHNFEHASHVMMSVTKLMFRIVAPTHLDLRKSGAETLHDHTYGITSDPLTQFACALSALIHDVDHTGVPNAQLLQENKALATIYRGRSVAEQNSLELAWSLLMGPCYQDLRRHIYTTACEQRRFRQLVVNSVMATDIVDKELKELRNARWHKAFAAAAGTAAEERVNVNRKATIVIEHLIQASDVSHTMQHWHIYRKWNQRFFEECYEAYLKGRAETDPSESWYKGEIGFFDFYIIPLAKKLKECGVFGKSSDEYLDYATHNRDEWVAKGQQLVAEMLNAIQQEENPSPCFVEPPTQTQQRMLDEPTRSTTATTPPQEEDSTQQEQKEQQLDL